MISRIMMILGEYPFSMHTAAFDSLQHSSDYNWQSQQRLGRNPAQQFMGMGEETISLSGLMLPDFGGGLMQVEAMRGSAAKGEPLILVSGNGMVLGKWCITKISDTSSHFWANGVPRKIEFSMELKAYGEDVAEEKVYPPIEVISYKTTGTQVQATEYPNIEVVSYKTTGTQI